jgi:hypothetical protein
MNRIPIPFQDTYRHSGGFADINHVFFPVRPLKHLNPIAAHADMKALEEDKLAAQIEV